MARDKFIQRRIYDLLSNRPLMAFVTTFLFVLSIFQIYGIYVLSSGGLAATLCEQAGCSARSGGAARGDTWGDEPVDAVYTWVNGSDPTWLRQLRALAGGRDDVDPSRYDDKQELKYSLRSLEQYAPWVRHVYVVTAGQLPWWLDAAAPRLTLVAHSDIMPPQFLPTFSSPAIECFIHKIPGLSERFLYFNDDIFLGSPLFLSDLYTPSEGYELYTAWNVPECAVGCPWSFLGDKSCDSACNVAACEYDGGDCRGPPQRHYGLGNPPLLPDDYDSPFFDEEEHLDADASVGRYPGFDEPPFNSKVVQARQHEDQDLLDSLRPELGPDSRETKLVKRETEDEFWAPKDPPSREADTVNHKITMRSLKSFPEAQGSSKEDINATAIEANTNDLDLRKDNLAIRDFNIGDSTGPAAEKPNSGSNLTNGEPLQINNSKENNSQLGREFPKNLYQKSPENLMEKLKRAASMNKSNVSQAVRHFNKSYLRADKKSRQKKSAHEEEAESEPGDERKLAMYARSLIYTNKLLNKEYGFQNRKVPAHVPFLLERGVLAALHARWPSHVAATARNRFRRPNDLQFAFAYYYFLMNEKRELSIEEIFDKYDTDKSGTWSDREVRTVLARVRGLPLTAEAVRALEAAARACDSPANSAHPTPPAERYLDSDMPTLSKALVCGCPALAGPLRAALGPLPARARPRPAASRHSFAMLDSNVTRAVAALDQIRRDTKKFICINDNLDPAREEENVIVRMLLQELYEALLPLPSGFELPPGVANRFLRFEELDAWRSGRRTAWLGLALCAALLAALSLYHLHSFRRSLHRVNALL